MKVRKVDGKTEWEKLEDGFGQHISWVEEGQTFVGVFIGSDKKHDGKSVLRYKFVNSLGEFSCACSRVLETRLANIKKSCIIKIVYKGKRSTENSARPFHDFTVYVKPLPSDWDNENDLLEVNVDECQFGGKKKEEF